MKTNKEQRIMLRDLYVRNSETNLNINPPHILIDLILDIEQLESRLKTQDARVKMLENALELYRHRPMIQIVSGNEINVWPALDALEASRALGAENKGE